MKLGLALRAAILAWSSAVLLLAAGAPSRAAVPIVYRHLRVEYDVNADGSYVETTHVEIQAENSAAAAEIGQIPLAYSASLQSLQVVQAYTLKPTGRRLPVAPSAIMVQLARDTPNVSLFGDFKQKVILFPDVAAGDIVVWTDRRRSKQQLFPGQFFMDKMFPRTQQYADVQVIVRAPRALPLRTEADGPGLAFEKEPDGNTVVYRWRYVSPPALPDDPAVISPYDRLPRIFASTFQTYDDLASAYTAMLDRKLTVTPSVQALADRITAGISDRRQQAHEIYNWVSTHIRYVAIVIGRTGVVPHDPDMTIADRYGDCKDHAVLFAALLKAKGIRAEPVLINGDNGYQLADTPNFAQLDHMIDWLPAFGFYADTTAGAAQFGTLPFADYGKPVVHLMSNGAVLRHTPVVPPGLALESVRTVETLSSDGAIEGTTVMTASGPLATELRTAGAVILARGPRAIADAILQHVGDDGDGSFDVGPPGALVPTYTITAHFKLDARRSRVSGGNFVPQPELDILPRPGDALIGPLKMTNLSDTEPTPCFSGTETEELSLELPPGAQVANLPADKQIQGDGMQYRSHWALAVDTLLTVRRTFTMTTDAPLCTGSTRTAAAAALRQIREDDRTAIAVNVH